MFGISRGRPAGGDLAHAHAAGELGGSGMVAAAVAFTDPDSGGRRDELGRHVVITNPQGAGDLAPIPGVETRPMLGGVRHAHHSELLRDTGMFDGSHVELTNRPPVVHIAPAVTAEAPPVMPALRVPPPSDPYGRACVNAAAVKAASR